MLSDIEIAQSAELKPIAEIANQLGISADELEFYGVSGKGVICWMNI